MRDTEAMWEQLRLERLALADFLETLSDDEWNTPSLCEGWRVRDVVAHLGWTPVAPKPELIRRFLAARGDVDRMGYGWAREYGDRSPAELVARTREIAGSRRYPIGVSKYEPLLDVLVHNSDIRRPLGKPRSTPEAAFRQVEHRVGFMALMLGGRKRVKGLRLRASDIEWSYGSGPEVAASTEALLMILSGRNVPAAELSGPGAPTLVARQG